MEQKEEEMVEGVERKRKEPIDYIQTTKQTKSKKQGAGWDIVV